jgi:hypothetical protein
MVEVRTPLMAMRARATPPLERSTLISVLDGLGTGAHFGADDPAIAVRPAAGRNHRLCLCAGTRAFFCSPLPRLMLEGWSFGNDHYS